MNPKNGKRKGLIPVFLLILFLVLLPLPAYTATFLQVVLRDSRQVVWERPVSSGDRFILNHRNSIYGSVVREAFLIDSDGFIWLDKIRTDSPAVLEYYGLEESTPDWIKLSQKIGKIPMLITPLGSVSLEWRKEIFALSALLPEGTLIEIRTHELP